jgi:hypothetical protein
MKAELAKLHRETIPPVGMLPISAGNGGRVGGVHKNSAN